MAASLTPEQLVWAYRQGVFPMAGGRQGPIQWFRPDPRAILPIEKFHASHSLLRRYRSGRFALTHNRAFAEVMRRCAQPRRGEPETWISDALIKAYTKLHRAGLAHSVEAWLDDQAGGEPKLAGGLYGVALGGAFFGESMFSEATDASKVCLVELVRHLRSRRYALLDVQFQSPHLARFGVIEIPRAEYERRLAHALALDVTWT